MVSTKNIKQYSCFLTLILRNDSWAINTGVIQLWNKQHFKYIKIVNLSFYSTYIKNVINPKPIYKNPIYIWLESKIIVYFCATAFCFSKSLSLFFFFLITFIIHFCILLVILTLLCCSLMSRSSHHFIMGKSLSTSLSICRWCCTL